MSSQNFAKENNVKLKISQQETLKAPNQDIETDLIEARIQKSSFESNRSYKKLPNEKRELDDFYNEEERPSLISKAPNDRSIEEAMLLSPQKPSSERNWDQTPKKATEISKDDSHSDLSLNIINSQDQYQRKSLKAITSGLGNDLFILKSETDCCDHKLKGLRPLVSTENPIRNEGVNFIAEASNWSGLRDFKSQLRGGAPQDKDGDDSSDIDYSALLAKLQQYKEKILNDTSLEKELNLFIELHASTIPGNQDHGRTNNESKNPEDQSLELSVDILRHFLDYESSEASKILLLTGQAGSGKSFYCKYLQRELLSGWFQNPDPEDRNWFPIYVELSSLKNPKSEAISETLTRELSLTKEEIRFLQDLKQSNLGLPRLLFIFDGYDAIEDIYAFDSLSSRKNFIDNNFFVLNKINGTSWKNAKFIITCREENLQKVPRRDLLFAPLINKEAKEQSVVSGAFLQRKIDPFSDEQITCYLKKYYYYELKATAEEGSSWSQIKKFEQLINNYHLRDIARTPFMLWIMCRALLKLMRGKPGRIDEMKFFLPQKLSRRFLIDFFVNEVISSITKETLGASNISENKEEHKDTHQEEDHPLADLHMKIRQQAQNFALKSKGYSINKAVNEHKQNDDLSTLKLDPLLTWDNNHSRVKFGYPLLLEFFVANSIEEEIGKIDPSTQPDLLKMKKKLLINQRLLTSEASGAIIIHFLIDVFKDEELTANQFISLIHLSREKELANQENNDEEIPNASHSSSQTPFTIAASNAITILNAAGYNFGSQDLSNINIPSVNLSFGMFEGTNFSHSNLQGVDFTGAWLKNANFVGANLDSVKFDAIRKLKLQNENIKNIAYSPDGEYFAVDIGTETVIFEAVDMRRSYFKEINRLPGYFLCWKKQSRTQVVTIQGERILIEKVQIMDKYAPSDQHESEYEFEYDYRYTDPALDEGPNACLSVWDFISGQEVEQLNLPIGNKKLISFNSENNQIIIWNNQQVQEYVTSDVSIRFPVKICNGVIDHDLTAKNINLLLVGDYLRKIILFNSITGKPILKQRQEVYSCKLSSNGQKIVSGTSHGVHISDCIRGCSIKSPINESKTKPEAIFGCSFSIDGKQIFAKTRYSKFILQDIADPKLGNLSLTLNTSDSPVYCFRPDGQQVAIVEESHTVFFHNLSMVADLSVQSSAIRGSNNKGLNLQGVIANSSVKLSEENIKLLRKTGDYGIFSESMIKKLFPSISTESEDVREVVVIDKELTSIHARIIGSDLNWINLQRLDLSRNDIGEEGGQAIGKNKAWTNLEGLILMYTEIGDETAKAIANNTNMQKLKKLQLASNKIGDIGAEAIGKNNIWTSLESLDLSSNQISDKDALILLCGNKTWERLESLFLGGNPVRLDKVDVHQIGGDIFSKCLKALALSLEQFGQTLQLDLKYSAPKSVTDLSSQKNPFNDILVEVIGSTTTSNLKKLCLSNNKIRDEGGKKIGSNSAWVDLEDLDLSENMLGAQTAVAIGENTTWDKLRILNLNGNSIGTEGCYAIGNNKTWIDLQTLELQGSLIGSKGVAALCQNKTWTKLQTLNLEKNLIDPEGAEELSQNTTWKNLQILNLSSNSLGAEGVARLIKNESWTNLQILNLSSNSLGTEGAARLSENTTWKNLQTLELKRNSISAKGVAKLSKNESWTNLQSLDLERNSIGAEGAANLRNNRSWTNLQSLNLSHNWIGVQGVEELINNSSLNDLQSLDLCDNSLGTFGAKMLSENAPWNKLQTLNLSCNSIIYKGAAWLSRNTSWKDLQSLDLSYNWIGNNGAEELSKNKSWTRLQSLNLSFNSIHHRAEDLCRNKTWTNLQSLNLCSNWDCLKEAINLTKKIMSQPENT